MLLACAGLLLGIAAADRTLPTLAPIVARPAALELGVALDLTVVSALLAWWMLRGTFGWDPSVHRRSAYGAAVVALLLSSAAEIPALHLLVGLWSDRAAWLLTALGLCGVLWVIDDRGACRLRPVRVGRGTLRIGFGLRWRVDVPLEHLLRIRPATGAERADRRSVDPRLSLPGAPWQVLELDRPVRAVGMYGLRREVRTPGPRVDDPERLGAALDAFRATRPRPPGAHTHDERT